MEKYATEVLAHTMPTFYRLDYGEWLDRAHKRKWNHNSHDSSSHTARPVATTEYRSSQLISPVRSRRGSRDGSPLTRDHSDGSVDTDISEYSDSPANDIRRSIEQSRLELPGTPKDGNFGLFRQGSDSSVRSGVNEPEPMMEPAVEETPEPVVIPVDASAGPAVVVADVEPPDLRKLRALSALSLDCGILNESGKAGCESDHKSAWSAEAKDAGHAAVDSEAAATDLEEDYDRATAGPAGSTPPKDDEKSRAQARMALLFQSGASPISAGMSPVPDASVGPYNSPAHDPHGGVTELIRNMGLDPLWIQDSFDSLCGDSTLDSVSLQDIAKWSGMPYEDVWKTYTQIPVHGPPKFEGTVPAKLDTLTAPMSRLASGRKATRSARPSLVPGRKWSTVRGAIQATSPATEPVTAHSPSFNNPIVDLEEFAIIVDMLLKLPELEDLILGVNSVTVEASKPRPHYAHFTSVVEKAQYEILNSCWQRADASHGFIHDLYNLHDPAKNNSMVDADSLLLDEEAMKEPMAHFYIRCSHNTYLPGAQVAGVTHKQGPGIKSSSQATEERYRDVLLQGCRCVEIDTYGKRAVTIKHGNFSGTGSLTLESVLIAIKDTAFRTSLYPVIISVEQHCNRAAQRRMAAEIRQWWGASDSHANYLAVGQRRRLSYTNSRKQLTPFRDSTPMDPEHQHFPSPHDLRSKIVIKHKHRAKNGRRYHEDLIVLSAHGKAQKVKVGDMAKATSARGLPVITSLSDTRCVKAFQMSRHRMQWRHFNNRHMTRVYPHRTRINSENFDPQRLWSVGVQLVALNMQSPGLPTYLDHGFFQQNGACGYVPKPDVLVNPVSNFDPWIPDTFCKPVGETQVLVVRILGARFLRVQTKEKRQARNRGKVSDPALDNLNVTAAEATRWSDAVYKPAQRPTVEVLVCGVPVDQQVPYVTNPSKSPGFSASWENETFVQEITCPEMASLGFVVREGGHTHSTRQDDYVTICGQYFIPLRSIRTGYRAVPLLNQINQRIPGSCLLVHIELRPQAVLLPVFRSQLEQTTTKGLRAYLLEERADSGPTTKRFPWQKARQSSRLQMHRPMFVNGVLGDTQADHTIECTPTSDSGDTVTIRVSTIRSVCCDESTCSRADTAHAVHGSVQPENAERDQHLLLGSCIYLTLSLPEVRRSSSSHVQNPVRGFKFTSRATAHAFLKFIVDNHDEREALVCQPLKRFLLDYNWAGRDMEGFEMSGIDAAGAQDIATSLRAIYHEAYSKLKLPTFGDTRNGQAQFPILKAHLRIARRLKFLRSHSGSRASGFGLHGNELVEVVSEESFVFQAKHRGALVLAPAGAGKTTMAHYLLSAWADHEFWSDPSRLSFQLVFFIPLDRLPNADFRDLSDLLHCLYFSGDLSITPAGLRALLKHAAASILLIFDSVDIHEWGRYPRIDDVILGRDEYTPMCMFFCREKPGDEAFETLLAEWQHNLYNIPPLDALNLERSILPIWAASHTDHQTTVQAHLLALHVKNHATLQQFMQDPGMLGLLTGIVCDYPHLFRRGNTYMGHAVLFEKITDMLIERNSSTHRKLRGMIEAPTSPPSSPPSRSRSNSNPQRPSLAGLSLGADFQDAATTILTGNQWRRIEGELEPLAELAYNGFRNNTKHLHVPSHCVPCVDLATDIGLLWRDTIIQFDGSRKTCQYKYHFCCASVGVYFAARYLADHPDALQELLLAPTDGPMAARRSNSQSIVTGAIDSSSLIAQTNLLVLDDQRYHGLLRFTVGIMASKHYMLEEAKNAPQNSQWRRSSTVIGGSESAMAALADAQITIIQTIANNCTREYNSYVGGGEFKLETGVQPALFALCLGCIYEMYTACGRKCLYGTLRPSVAAQQLLGRAGEAASRVLREKLSLNGKGGRSTLTVRDLSAIASVLGFLGVISTFNSVSLAILTDIDVGNNGIGKEGCRILAEGLKGNKSVRMLNVNDNNVGKDGAAALARILTGEHRCVIEQIRAHGNELGDLGALEFAKVIAADDCILTYLGIMRNEIGDYGANQLFETALRSTSLAQLGLMDNRIGDSGAHAAGRLLRSPTCVLTHLALGRNRITAEGIRSISDGLKTNETLLSCLMVGNVVADELSALQTEAELDSRLDFEHDFFKVTKRAKAVESDARRATSVPSTLTDPASTSGVAHSMSLGSKRPSKDTDVGGTNMKRMPMVREVSETSDRTSGTGTPLSVQDQDAIPLEGGNEESVDERAERTSATSASDSAAPRSSSGRLTRILSTLV